MKIIKIQIEKSILLIEKSKFKIEKIVFDVGT